MKTQDKNSLENLGQFIRTSVTIKLLAIFIMMLLLMIPVAFIIQLINERFELRQLAVSDVSSKWANRQIVYGPVLTIPFMKNVLKDGAVNAVHDYAHILPSMLTVNGKVEPQTLHRGIFKVVVYDSRISFAGNFANLDDYIAKLSDHNILWDQAFVTIHVSDLRGIREKVVMNWNRKKIPVIPGSRIPELVNSGMTVDNILENDIPSDTINFSFDILLQGSQYLGFLPLGKETHVNLVSPWQDPSFSGAFLPDNRTVESDGFRAAYKILELNRNYPQFWIGLQHTNSLQESAFGVDLLLPVNDYQKAIRSAKYALLVISLTFLTFFLVEIFNRTSVHPVQYILIGLALCLFYILLLSVSEQTSFNKAYLVASITVISIIGFYARAILKSLKQTVILVMILCLTYSFVYITLQIQDYALLIGSIGLTVILAFTMYITRNINWYNLNSLNSSNSALD